MTSTDLMNVTAFENQLPDAAFASLNPESESLADGIGQSYGVVGYKGKVWTLRYRGETYTFTRPDDGSPAAFLDVIVLRSASYRSKSWYEGGYQEGVSGQRPTCSSLDGVTPDRDATKPQATACALCPKNEFKQAANGRKGKDCSDYKRLAVLILPSTTARIFGGSALMEPVFLRVPAASLNDLATLGEAMSRKGFHYATYITRIGFDVEKPHPQMTFRALQKLTAQEAPLVIQMREDPQAYRITGENDIGKAKTLGHPNASATPHSGAVEQQRPTVLQPAVQPSPVQADPRAANVSAQNVPQNVSPNDEIALLKARLAAAELAASRAATEAGGVRTGPASAVSATQSGAQPETAAVDTGFGSATIIPPTSRTPVQHDEGLLGANQPVINVAPENAASIADTGPADESDADLDARVAGLLQR